MEKKPSYPVQTQPLAESQPQPGGSETSQTPATDDPISVPTSHIQSETTNFDSNNSHTNESFQEPQPAPPGGFSQNMGFQPDGVPLNSGVIPTSTSPYIYWGRTPQYAQCQSCNKVVMTEVELKIGASTWLFCLGLAVAIGWCLPFVCFIPFCKDGSKDAIHSCPDCKIVIVRRRR